MLMDAAAPEPGMETRFASAERLDGESLRQQVRLASTDPCVQVVLSAVGGHLLILNAHRQILAVNRGFLDLLKRESSEFAIGLRPGEVLNCVHAKEGPGGCGTSDHCRTCGAVLAILASQVLDKSVTEECRLSSLDDGRFCASDFRVTASPLVINGEPLTAMVLMDISGEKRREVLEQTFLHDLANSLGGIEAWGQLMQHLDPRVAAREILALTDALKAEIVSHRILVSAENGDLVPQTTPCNVNQFLESLEVLFRSQSAHGGRELRFLQADARRSIATDRGLLLRVLANMVKNAIEAVPAGAVVHVRFEDTGGRPEFIVENPGEIPTEIRTHIFERSFSTKATKGRGIGTYCMKLLGERYLGGTVSFRSEQGCTTFSIVLPAAARGSDASVSPPGELASASRPMTSGSTRRRVLLAEDDDSLRRLGGLFIRQLGFEVVACRDGAEAERAFRESPDSFALVITDARMPGMNGSELARRLHSIREGTPVLLCSGGAEACDEEFIKQGGFVGVIQKPYSIPSLSESMRRAIPT
jgi:CheY-like chemotaxis protein